MVTEKDFEKMLEKAKDRQISNKEFMRFCLDNYDDLLKVLDWKQRQLLKGLKPLMKLATK